MPDEIVGKRTVSSHSHFFEAHGEGEEGRMNAAAGLLQPNLSAN